jgi:WD40 repeat protein
MGRDPGELYRGARLSAALEGTGLDLNPAEAEFLEESRIAAERERASMARANRRLRSLLAGAAIALVLALVAGGVALVQRSSARGAATRAEVSKLAAQSRELTQTKPDLGLLLAVEAYRHQDSIESRGAVLGALATHPSLQTQLYGVTSNVGAATFSPDGKLLAVVSNVEAIFYDVATHKRVGAVLRAEGRRWWHGRFTPDGRYLAIPNDPGNVELWDVATRKKAGELRGIDKVALAAVRFSLDGKIAAAGAVDIPHVTFFDMRTRRAIGKPMVVDPVDSVDAGGVHEYAFSPNGETLAVPGGPGINFWNVKTRKLSDSLAVGDAGAGGFQYLPGGRGIVSSGDGTVSVWDLPTKKRLSQVSIGDAGLSAPAVSPDERFVAATTDDGRTFIWEIETAGRFGPVLQADRQQFLDLQWSPDSKLLATAHSRSVALWDMTGRQAISVPTGGEDATVLGVAFSPDGKLLALGHRAGSVVLRDAKTLRTVGELHPKGDTLAIAFSPDGRLMATAGQDTKVQVWNVATRRKAGSLDLVDAWAWDVAFSPDGKLIAVGTDPNSQRNWYVPNREGAALLFDARTNERVGRPMVPGKGNYNVQGVAFSPDSKLLVTASYYYRTQLWDVATQRKHGKPMDVPDDSPIAVAFSPDGRNVAAGYGSGVERIWDVATQGPAIAPLEGQSNFATGIAYSSDGRYLADATVKGGVRLWDAKTGVGYGDRELVASDRPVSVEPSFDFPEPLRAAFSPDGRLLAIGGIDNRPMLLRIDPQVWPERACAVAGRNLTRDEWSRYLPGEAYRGTCAAFSAGSS